MDTNGKLNIYIIIGKGYNKDRVVRELKEEGYPHNFFFGNITDVEYKEVYLETADEVWTFGDCTGIYDYEEAIELGSDLWNMG